jgi:hypothetical protein
MVVAPMMSLNRPVRKHSRSRWFRSRNNLVLASAANLRAIGVQLGLELTGCGEGFPAIETTGEEFLTALQVRAPRRRSCSVDMRLPAAIEASPHHNRGIAVERVWRCGAQHRGILRGTPSLRSGSSQQRSQVGTRRLARPPPTPSLTPAVESCLALRPPVHKGEALLPTGCGLSARPRSPGETRNFWPRRLADRVRGRP